MSTHVTHAESQFPEPFAPESHLQSVLLPVGEKESCIHEMNSVSEGPLRVLAQRDAPCPLALSLCKLCPYSDQGMKVYRKGIILFLNLRS